MFVGICACMNNPRPDSPASIVVCGHLESESFAPSHRTPHLPVLAAFGSGPMHRFSRTGRWDLEKAATENENRLLRSDRTAGSEHPPCWEDLTFQFGSAAFLHADSNSFTGFAQTAAEAETLVKNFVEKYTLPAAADGGCYSLVRLGRDLERIPVRLDEGTALSEETLALHYGEEALSQHLDLVSRLSIRKHGVALFEGPQGTGKKSYIRHLIGELRNSHRFYFIPAPAPHVLSNACFPGFWIDQRCRYRDKRFALILEDSDELLAANGKYPQAVQALLQLTDGLLADFLRLQIICTINCKATDIDQALLRPGRLLSHRVFHRLDYAQASLLAESLGRKLPSAQDYSLAEVFAGCEPKEIQRSRIGFPA
jgi:hypothetical protein